MKLQLPQALFTAVLAALAAVPAQAATYTWGGSNNELWWTEGAWKDGTTSVKWANGSNAILNGLVSAKEPMRAKFSGTGEISAKDVTVTTGSYFRLTCQDTPTINFSSLTVSQDSTLEIGGSLANRPFAVTNLALNGTMTIKSAMHITEISSLSSTGSLTILYDSETKSGNVVTIDKISGLSKAISIEGAALTLGSTTTPATIAVTDAITVTGGDTTNYLDDKGKKTKDGNGFRIVTQATMTLFNLSDVSKSAAKLTTNDAQVIRKVGDGKDGFYTLGNDGIATKAAGTDYSTYYLKTGDDSVSAMAKAASDNKGKLTTVDMTSTGTLTVDAALDTLYAHTQGGTVDMTLGKAITNMTVNADTTILTDEDKTVETTMEVESGKKVSIKGEGGIKTGGVVIAGRDNKTPATITNRGESADYTPGNDDMEISNATVEVTDASAAEGDLLTINNKLIDTKLINKSGVTVHSTNGAKLTDIAAISGNVVVTNLAEVAQALSLDTLTIAANKQVGVYTGNEMTEDAVAELTVTGTLTVGGAGASLNANLTLGSGSVLDLSAGSALTLGCTLGLEDGLTFVLSEQQLNDLTTGGSVLLMDGVDALSSTLPTSFTVTDSVGQAFGGPVVLTYQGTELRLIPEPATATLSLLALAGLAARRRRK